MKRIPKPEADEHGPNAGTMYVALLPDDGLVLQHMQENVNVLKSLVTPLSEEKLTTPCAPDEWTIKEILAHIIDTERILAYRALRFARHDTTTPLPGYVPDDYVKNSRANERPLADILAEYETVRAATLTLFHSLHEDTYALKGMAYNYPTSVRALAYIIAGHELHHINSVKENYL